MQFIVFHRDTAGKLVRFECEADDFEQALTKHRHTYGGVFNAIAWRPANQDFQVQSRTELESVLEDITFDRTCLDFKWKFEITLNNDLKNPGWFVNVAFERPDTETGEIGIGRGRKEFVALGAWESGIVKTGWLLVELVVRHELMEAFHYKGKRIFNPHNSVHALASIQKD